MVDLEPVVPCCCHNQLPAIAKENEGRVYVYHTDGDVPLERVLFSVAELCGKSEVTIILPRVDIKFLRKLHWGMERQWYSVVRIMTGEEQKEMMQKELPEAVYVHNKGVTALTQMLTMVGNKGRITITGYHPLQSPADSGEAYQVTTHTMLYEPAEAQNDETWGQVTAYLNSKLRTAVRKLPTD